MSSIALPSEYGYTAAALVSVFYVTTWQTFKVSAARKASGVQYPQLYAEKAQAESSKAAMIFNCTQRAHQNTLETVPLVLGGTAIIALNFPVAAAGICGLWSLARVLYTIGYSTGESKRRNFLGANAWNALSMAGLLFGSTYSVAKLLM